MHLHLSKLGSFVLLSAAAHAGSVRLVDPAAGPYHDIQSAVNASAPGDVVLVKSGAYAAFTVASRDVAVVAEIGTTAVVSGGVRVTGLDAGETFLLGGVRASGDPSALDERRHALSAQGCVGSIRVVDCELTGADGVQCQTPPANGIAAGARFDGCADVFVATSTLIGGAAGGHDSVAQPTGRGGPGFEASASRVVVDGVESRGGNGRPGCPDGSSGGHGARVTGGAQLYVSSSALHGANGGTAGFAQLSAFGGDGGHGLLVESTCLTIPTVRAIALDAAGGLKGAGFCNFPGCVASDYDGDQGLRVRWNTACGALQAIDEIPTTLAAPLVAREGTTIGLAFTGTHGDRLWLRIARGTDHAWMPAYQGVLLVEAQAPARWRELGEIGQSGHAAFTLPIAMLPAGEQARIVHMQVLATRRDGSIRLGSATSLVILDSSF